MWRDYYQLMRLDKPIGILLALWPSLWALWLAAAGMPPLSILLIFLVGATLARSAGCIINDYSDRHFDKHIARTQHRPLTTGRIQPNHALLLFAVLGLAALALTLLLGKLCFIIALFTALFTTIYPLLKRITHLPQLGLGIVFNTGVLMAFAAVQQQLPVTAWLLFITAVIWTIAYDTMYAMTDRPDDIKIAIKSTAILFGRFDVLIISALLTLVFIGLISLGLSLTLHWPYYLGLLIGALLTGQQIWRIKSRDRAACFSAFLHSNRVGLVIFLGLVINYLL